MHVENLVMSFDWTTIVVTAAGVFSIGFMKGAFGGGFAIIGIPLLALVMEPLQAGALLAPLLVAMDVFALRYWKPTTWSKQELRLLVPGLVIGVVLGLSILRSLDRHAVEILIAATTLTFAFWWWRGAGAIAQHPRATSAPKALLAGAASGVSTMIAHSGGPPLALYLLPLHLPKQVYAGTTSIFFTIGNVLKLGPWLVVGPITASLSLLTLISLPAAILGVWCGWHFHQRLDQGQLYRLCYVLLVVTAVKLLWDGISGFTANGDR